MSQQEMIPQRIICDVRRKHRNQLYDGFITALIKLPIKNDTSSIIIIWRVRGRWSV